MGKRFERFTKDIQIANEHVKRCSTLLVIIEMPHQNHNEILLHSHQNAQSPKD